MLSIIITHHKTPILLKLCLKSIKENVGDIEYEIIVVDSEGIHESQEEIREWFDQLTIKNFPEIRFISFRGNAGYAKIVNEGITRSRGEYVLILNADIIILNGSIDKLIKFIQEHPKVGIVGPRLLTFSGAIQNSCFHFPTIGAIIARRTFLGKLNWGRNKIEQFLIFSGNDNQSYPVDWLQGSAMLVRKAAIEKVGLLDESFFMYLEDADWCRRFWQNGFEVVYLSTAQMAHYYYRTSQKWGGLLDLFLNKYARMHLMSAFKYFWKWRKA